MGFKDYSVSSSDISGLLSVNLFVLSYEVHLGSTYEQCNLFYIRVSMRESRISWVLSSDSEPDPDRSFRKCYFTDRERDCKWVLYIKVLL